MYCFFFFILFKPNALSIFTRTCTRTRTRTQGPQVQPPSRASIEITLPKVLPMSSPFSPVMTRLRKMALVGTSEKVQWIASENFVTCYRTPSPQIGLVVLAWKCQRYNSKIHHLYKSNFDCDSNKHSPEGILKSVDEPLTTSYSTKHEFQKE